MPKFYPNGKRISINLDIDAWARAGKIPAYTDFDKVLQKVFSEIENMSNNDIKFIPTNAKWRYNKR